MPGAAIEILTPEPYELRLGLFGHGWIELPPNGFDDETETWTTALRLDDRTYRAEVRAARPGALTLRVHGDARPGKRVLAAAAQTIRHMLRLDDDLTELWAACRREPRLHWAGRRGAGRLLRSASVFEDLMKLLFTTNTTWAGTVTMTRKLVEHCGTEGAGVRAFPTPRECVRSEAFYRDTIRTGYRAAAAVALARGFESGELTDELFLHEPDTDTLRDRLLALRGFGPYAAGQALRLLGHYGDLALDSWCRARIAQLLGRKKPPTDRGIARRYATFRPFQGLAMWLDLTAEWHGE